MGEVALVSLVSVIGGDEEANFVDGAGTRGEFE